jgi:hypothetical protein
MPAPPHQFGLSAGTSLAVLLAPLGGAVSGVLAEGECATVSDTIPTITRKYDPGRSYDGAVIYSRQVELEEGETILVLGEIQAVNDTEDSLMFATYLVIAEDAFSEEPHVVGETPDWTQISPRIGFNIAPLAHYGVMSRHGVFEAPEAGTYQVGLVAYGASAILEEDTEMETRGGCSLTVLRLN